LLARKHKTNEATSVVVIGLGRFGTAVAQSLVQMGKEVLAVDENFELVSKWADQLTHVVQADSTDEQALAQLGVGDFDRAVVAIGTDIEASVLTVVALAEAGVADIWAKAITSKHGEILEKVGAHHVVYPEQAMGERVAHMIAGSMTDYIEFDDEFSIARAQAPAMTWDKALSESSPRTRFGVTIVGVKRVGEDFTYARPETVVHRHDQLIVSGPTRKVEEFCALR
jgi:trk system potassium uptake protein TrkA